MYNEKIVLVPVLVKVIRYVVAKEQSTSSSLLRNNKRLELIKNNKICLLNSYDTPERNEKVSIILKIIQNRN